MTEPTEATERVSHQRATAIAAAAASTTAPRRAGGAVGAAPIELRVGRALATEADRVALGAVVMMAVDEATDAEVAVARGVKTSVDWSAGQGGEHVRTDKWCRTRSLGFGRRCGSGSAGLDRRPSLSRQHGFNVINVQLTKVCDGVSAAREAVDAQCRCLGSSKARSEA